MPFVHLHVHSEYSLLDGCARIPELAAAASRLGFAALALTDHGAVYGAVPFTKALREAGVRPLLGAELYLVDEFGPPPKPLQPYHLPLLAATEEGYVHLMELVTLGHLDHFYKKPLLTMAEIAPRAGGLVALSGCLRGQLSRLILAGEEEKARQCLGEWGEIFGRDRFFLELQRHGLPAEERANAGLVALARREGFSLAATNDVHYLEKEDADSHDLLLAVQTLSALDDPDRLRLPAAEYYLKSAMEMEALFDDLPEALRNTAHIAEMCRFELELGKRRIPAFPVPGGLDQAAYLKLLCEQGLRERFPEPGEEVLARLEYELDVIERLGFSGYFLIVWDIIAYARREGIPVGPGRGSSVGSLVAYLLGITDVDPLRHGLIFERFLNPERAEPPDIDVDLCHRGRARVLDYIRERYGRDRVAHLAAFTTLKPRAAVRDAGRALGLVYDKVDRLAKAIPFVAPDMEAALGESARLRALRDREADAARVIDAAASIGGLPRHLTQHAAGVVVAAEPLTRYVALEEAGEGEIVTQADMGSVEDLGLMKIDLLGLRYLTVIRDTLDFLGREGIALTTEGIPLDDRETYASLSAGRTMGVFQLESAGMRDLLRRYQPEKIEDIMLIIALYRPGPLGSGMVESVIRRRHGEEEVAHPHPDLAEVLGCTYGAIVYQEQVMETARILAGYTPGQADLLRKAIAKRRPELLAREGERFVKGAISRGVPESTARGVFDLVAEFGHYGFAKAHSAAYALTSYRTAFLKTHHPVPYHAALLSLNMGGAESRFPAYLNEARRLGIPILLPEVNRSGAVFQPEEAGIRAGLALVKDLGARGIAAILKEREKGPFRSLGDFCMRLRGKGLTARAAANLIRAGAFDAFGPRAAQLLELHTLWSRGKAVKPRRPGQLRLFGPDELEPLAPPRPVMPEYSEEARREMEREVLGHYLTCHPLEQYRARLAAAAVTEIEELGEEEGPAKILLCGMIGGIRPGRTRRGERMAFAILEDLTGQAELVIFPSVLQREGHHMGSGGPLLVWGRVDRTAERISVVVERMRRFSS